MYLLFEAHRFVPLWLHVFILLQDVTSHTPKLDVDYHFAPRKDKSQSERKVTERWASSRWDVLHPGLFSLLLLLPLSTYTTCPTCPSHGVVAVTNYSGSLAGEELTFAHLFLTTKWWWWWAVPSEDFVYPGYLTPTMRWRATRSTTTIQHDGVSS